MVVGDGEALFLRAQALTATVQTPWGSGKSQPPLVATLPSERSVLPKKEMHLALFRLASLTNSAEGGAGPFFYLLLILAGGFFPVLRLL